MIVNRYLLTARVYNNCSINPELKKKLLFKQLCNITTILFVDFFLLIIKSGRKKAPNAEHVCLFRIRFTMLEYKTS